MGIHLEPGHDYHDGEEIDDQKGERGGAYSTSMASSSPTPLVHPKLNILMNS